MPGALGSREEYGTKNNRYAQHLVGRDSHVSTL